MAKIPTPTPTQIAWQESHRCVICNGLPVTFRNELVEPQIVLRPEYRHLAQYPIPAEPWQTEQIGGEWFAEVECENGHLFRCRYHQFREEAE